MGLMHEFNWKRHTSAQCYQIIKSRNNCALHLLKRAIEHLKSNTDTPRHKSARKKRNTFNSHKITQHQRIRDLGFIEETRLAIISHATAAPFMSAMSVNIKAFQEHDSVYSKWGAKFYFPDFKLKSASPLDISDSDAENHNNSFSQLINFALQTSGCVCSSEGSISVGPGDNVPLCQSVGI